MRSARAPRSVERGSVCGPCGTSDSRPQRDLISLLRLRFTWANTFGNRDATQIDSHDIRAANRMGMSSSEDTPRLVQWCPNPYDHNGLPGGPRSLLCAVVDKLTFGMGCLDHRDFLV
eukprot:2562172-Pleurochrysis_carterae.AAC.3